MLSTVPPETTVTVVYGGSFAETTVLVGFCLMEVLTLTVSVNGVAAVMVYQIL